MSQDPQNPVPPSPLFPGDDHTEADEAAPDLTTALLNLEDVLGRHTQGLETAGVVALYEEAARKQGATPDMIDAAHEAVCDARYDERVRPAFFP